MTLVCMVLKLDTLERRSEIPGKSSSVVLENGGDQFYRLWESSRSITWSQGGKQDSAYNTVKEMYLDWLHPA